MKNIKIKHEIVHSVISNTDLTEGRGRAVIIGRFISANDAAKRAKGAGVFGSDAKIESRTVHVVYFEDKLFLLGDQVTPITSEEMRLQMLRAEALNKLTEEEKSALGLI